MWSLHWRTWGAFCNPGPRSDRSRPKGLPNTSPSMMASGSFVFIVFQMEILLLTDFYN